MRLVPFCKECLPNSQEISPQWMYPKIVKVDECLKACQDMDCALMFYVEVDPEALGTWVPQQMLRRSHTYDGSVGNCFTLPTSTSLASQGTIPASPFPLQVCSCYVGQRSSQFTKKVHCFSTFPCLKNIWSRATRRLFGLEAVRRTQSPWSTTTLSTLRCSGMSLIPAVWLYSGMHWL